MQKPSVRGADRVPGWWLPRPVRGWLALTLTGRILSKLTRYCRQPVTRGSSVIDGQALLAVIRVFPDPSAAMRTKWLSCP